MCFTLSYRRLCELWVWWKRLEETYLVNDIFVITSKEHHIHFLHFMEKHQIFYLHVFLDRLQLVLKAEVAAMQTVTRVLFCACGISKYKNLFDVFIYMIIYSKIAQCYIIFHNSNHVLHNQSIISSFTSLRPVKLPSENSNAKCFLFLRFLVLQNQRCINTLFLVVFYFKRRKK